MYNVILLIVLSLTANLFSAKLATVLAQEMVETFKRPGYELMDAMKMNPLLNKFRPESELRLEVEHLLNAGSVLYVAAHPDDENNLLFTKLARGNGFRVGYFCFTRGEGGQNLIGEEQGAALGVLRTQELLAARQLDGAEQFFGGMRDFGFSKSAEETLQTWGKEASLGALVRAVREFQPDIMITRFPTSGEGGHGHHTASAILAKEAFSAAADPMMFTEQLTKLKTWRVKRLFYNELPDRFLKRLNDKEVVLNQKSSSDAVVSDRGSETETSPSPIPQTVQVHIEGYHPALGETYSEIAAKARSLHRSQGMGSIPEIFPVIENFRLVAGQVLEDVSKLNVPLFSSDGDILFSGLDSSWSNVESGNRFLDKVNKSIAEWNGISPELNLPNLLQALSALRRLPSSAIRDYSELRLVRLIREIAGIKLLALPEMSRFSNASLPGGNPGSRDRSIPLSKVEHANILVGQPIKIRIYPESKVKIQIQSLKPSWTEEINLDGIIKRETAGGGIDLSLPTEDLRPGEFLYIRWKISIDGVDIAWDEPIYISTSDQVFGEQRIPLRIVPDFTLTPLMKSVYLSTSDSGWIPISFTVKRWNQLRSFVDLTAIVDTNWDVDREQQRVDFRSGAKSEKVVFRLRRNLGEGDKKIKEGVLKIMQSNGAEISSDIIDLREISYPHIVPQAVEYSSNVKLIPLKLKSRREANRRIGFIAGASDSLPDYLRNWGNEVEMLDIRAIQECNLSDYDVIILGIRSMAVHQRMHEVWSNLEKYTLDGGLLLILYQQANDKSGVRVRLGDVQFLIGKGRVTQENAPVRLIDPKARIVRSPNIIREEDFSNWIQERGLSFADEWNDLCVPALEMNDEGDPPLQGALLDCKLGKGRVIYTGLSFFRQIPNGNAGAVRLIENLLVN